MFDFTPVGGAAAFAGLLFVALLGWRLIPATKGKASAHLTFDLAEYIAEARVKDGSRLIGKSVQDVDRQLEDNASELLAVVRNGIRIPSYGQSLLVAEGDVLVVEAAAESIDKVMGELGLEYQVPEHQQNALKDLTLIEVVVPPEARLAGRSAHSSGLLYHFAMSLVGVSRRGRRIHERLGRLTIEAGDVLLLLVPEKQQAEIIEWTGFLPLASRGLAVSKRSLALFAAGAFAGAIAAATAGMFALPTALAICVLLFIAAGLLSPREIYTTVEWPVIVLLGSMIPLGAALEASGGTARIADALAALTAGSPPWVSLAVLMVVTMTLSDVLNNVATAVIAAPVALGMAQSLGVNPDPFLMAVAIASSCAFLTPIGHKNNILVLGPGGYRFGDYWRMGLPLEIIVLAVSLPLLLMVWPL
jgi:di/tricarboxylate transporter